jgi:hypothetical protein
LEGISRLFGVLAIAWLFRNNGEIADPIPARTHQALTVSFEQEGEHEHEHEHDFSESGKKE